MKKVIDLMAMLLIGGSAGLAINYANTFSRDNFTAEWECGVYEQFTVSNTDVCSYDEASKAWLLKDGDKTIKTFRF